jgi:serine protease inhibitor
MKKDYLLMIPMLSHAINTFTCDLYHTIATANTGNFVLSPYSISTAFAMVQVGARGETAAEIARVFQYPPDVAD